VENKGFDAEAFYRALEITVTARSKTWKQVAAETGGKAFFPNQVTELAGIYTQISEELSSQYTVGYSSRNVRRDGTWRRVVVRVNRPSSIARTKQGYFAPSR